MVRKTLRKLVSAHNITETKCLKLKHFVSSFFFFVGMSVKPHNINTTLLALLLFIFFASVPCHDVSGLIEVKFYPFFPKGGCSHKHGECDKVVEKNPNYEVIIFQQKTSVFKIAEKGCLFLTIAAERLLPSWCIGWLILFVLRFVARRHLASGSRTRSMLLFVCFDEGSCWVINIVNKTHK